MRPRHMLVLVLALAFALSSAAVFAQQVKWLVIQDRNGHCRVIDSLKDKTPDTILGPFKTKEEAIKAKEKDKRCAAQEVGKKPEPMKPHTGMAKPADKDKAKVDDKHKATDKDKAKDKAKDADKDKHKAADKDKAKDADKDKHKTTDKDKKKVDDKAKVDDKDKKKVDDTKKK
jgi:hypothetical protein